MAEMMTQAEIDALLSSLASGNVNAQEISAKAEEKIRSYDFKRPSKFSRDQVRALQVMHDNFARMLSNLLSAQLRTLVQIAVAAIDHQMTYVEFLNSMQNPTIMMVFSLAPLKGTAILEISLGLAYAIIDRLLGGPGVGIEEARPLTEIEQSVMMVVCERILEQFKEVWRDVIELDPKIEFYENNPMFVQIASPNETVALISLTAQVGAGEGFMNICLPHMVLEPIMTKLTSRYLVSATVHGGNNDPEVREAIFKDLSSTSMDLAVEMGTIEISLGELLGLQVGDCLRLGRAPHDDIDVRVGPHLRYKARPGTMQRRLAAQIVDIVEPY
ncbi:MAG: flagellar motor switch protein FliM [Symbiobacteriaceae bacterium]|nr:flagellar motor switch protein FliM [Symbiobacteriaceae bacterium]